MNENPRLFGYGSAKYVLVIAAAIDRLTSPKPQVWCVFWDFIRWWSQKRLTNFAPVIKLAFALLLVAANLALPDNIVKCFVRNHEHKRAKP